MTAPPPTRWSPGRYSTWRTSPRSGWRTWWTDSRGPSSSRCSPTDPWPASTGSSWAASASWTFYSIFIIAVAPHTRKVIIFFYNTIKNKVKFNTGIVLKATKGKKKRIGEVYIHISLVCFREGRGCGAALRIRIRSEGVGKKKFSH
jgi:hypothetical protein